MQARERILDDKERNELLRLMLKAGGKPRVF